MYTRKAGPVHEAAHTHLIIISGGDKALKALLHGKPFGENEMLDRFFHLKLKLQQLIPKSILRFVPEKFILRLSMRMRFE
jgi:hypothetical protein